MHFTIDRGGFLFCHDTILPQIALLHFVWYVYALPDFIDLVGEYKV